MVSALNLVVNYINTLAKEVLIHNTICQSTAMRQKEAKELAQESDLMIVVGSKKSANTTHLAEILKDCTETIHIENDSELNVNSYQNAVNIGITAGASTPDTIIKKVITKIEKEKIQ
jgi:4-hydroxy-3-methylbut-2-enyl diphosphate reductase